MASAAIAVQTWTIRDSIKTADDTARSMARLAKIGYRAVELAGGSLSPQEWRRVLDDNGLKTAGVHVPLTQVLDSPQAVADMLATLDCPQASFSGVPNETRDNEQAMARFLGTLNQAGARLREQGRRLGYHNHSFEFERYSGRSLLQRLVEGTNPQDVMFQLDTYWVQHGGGSPAGWIRALKGRCPLVHIKDMGVLGGKPVFMPIGQGNLEWRDIFAAGDAAGVECYIIEQDNCNGVDPFDALASSLSFLRSIGRA